MAIPQLPRLCDLMTPAVQALLAARPKAELHLASGVYGDVLAGWEAQATIWRAYIAKECRAGRLPLSVGSALVELAGSDYWSAPDSSAQKAVGEAQLYREIINTTASGVGTFATGTVKNGSRFALTAAPSARPPVQAAQFVSTAPVYVGPDSDATVDLGGGQFKHTQHIPVPIEASTTGTQANTVAVFGEDNSQGTSVDTLFDTTLTVQFLRAAGGSTGVDDPWRRIIAASELAGFFGPNNAALVAGTMEVPRVRRMAISLDTVTAISRVFVADVSWAYSNRLLELVTQNIAKTWQGWGCRVKAFGVFNQLIGVTGALVIDSSQSLTDSADIANNVRTALRAYFDDRPDWYTFRNQAVRSVIAHADPRILTCTSASVLDPNNNVISEPPKKVAAGATFALHYSLLDDAVRLTFAAPS